MTAYPESIALAKEVAGAAWDKKSTDIIAIDVSSVLFITDVFVICSAANPRHVSGIVDEIEHRVKMAGGGLARREGQRDASWVLLDFKDIVVHVQLATERANYGLERLWRDCPVIDLGLELAPEVAERSEVAQDVH